MKTWFFRFVDEDRRPTGYVGMATASNLRDLFWTIDEFGDPYMAQVVQASGSTGICLHVETYRGQNGELLDAEDSNLEKSWRFPLPDEPLEWKTPRWPDPAYPT